MAETRCYNADILGTPESKGAGLRHAANEAFGSGISQELRDFRLRVIEEKTLKENGAPPLLVGVPAQSDFITASNEPQIGRPTGKLDIVLEPTNPPFRGLRR